MSKAILFSALTLILTSCAHFKGAVIKDEHELIGTWVQEQDEDITSIRYVRSDTLITDLPGVIFKENGECQLYEAFGCQMPIPNLRVWNATYELKRGGRIEIDRNYPGQRPQNWYICALDSSQLRFVYD